MALGEGDDFGCFLPHMKLSKMVFLVCVDLPEDGHSECLSILTFSSIEGLDLLQIELKLLEGRVAGTQGKDRWENVCYHNIH